ncbi:unnamed protein product [Rhodiola kirilowii]
MADVLLPVYDFELMNLLRAGKLETGCGAKRFLAVQATELANGGFFLSCSMSHAFGDGSSFWHFFNSWSEICHGCDSPKNLPLLECCYPGQAEIWIPNQLIAHQPSTENDRLSQSAFKEKIFVFPKEKIALLKPKAIEQTGNQKISSLQAMLAFVWKLTSRYRQIQDEEIVILYMPTDVRTRAGPPLTKYYLGNAIQTAETTMKGKDLRGDDAFGRAASKMHDLVASQSKTTVKNFLTSYIEKPFVFGKSNGGNTKVVTIVNSPRFEVYGNDFGWGRPVAIRRCLENEMEGMIQLFEGPENGSVHMELCLLPETLELLENDSDFLNFVWS